MNSHRGHDKDSGFGGESQIADQTVGYERRIDMKNTKKQFQKVIGNIRKDRNTKEGINSSYPKPMMTVVQMEKKEATVNCGGEFSTAEKTMNLANTVMGDERFKNFITSTGADANIEMNNFGTYQIRIKF